MTRYVLLFDSCGRVFVGRPLWREGGSVFCICCWPLPAQSFSDSRPLGLSTIFYCLTFETSLFVASYDSQGHGGGIRLRLHQGEFFSAARDSRYIASERPQQKTPFHNNYCIVIEVFTSLLHRNGGSIVVCVFVSTGTCLPSRCLAVNVYSGFQASCYNIYHQLFTDEMTEIHIGSPPFK
jgi:hypothetical protein